MNLENQLGNEENMKRVEGNRGFNLYPKMQKKYWGVTLVCIIMLLAIIFLLRFQKNFSRSQNTLVVEKAHQSLQKIEEATYEGNANGENKSTVKNIEVKNYQSNSDIKISPPKNLQIYSLKNNFSLTDAKKITEKLIGSSVDVVSEDKESIVFQNENNLMTFHPLSGNFELISGEIEVGEDGYKDNGAVVTKFLRERLVGIDESISLTSIYERASAPGMKYFEFHRSWEKVGLPIINPGAILTLSSGKKISEFSLSKFEKDDLEDTEIINATDQSGKARKTDFNSLTLSLTATGKIESITSNIRFIENTKNIDTKIINNLTSHTIIAKLKKENTIYDQALPAGEGQIDLQKVFPNGEMKTENGQIKDVSLVFFEKNPNQVQFFLQPMILVRGSAKTNGGFEVSFSQSMPLIEDPELAIDFQN